MTCISAFIAAFFMEILNYVAHRHHTDPSGSGACKSLIRAVRIMEDTYAHIAESLRRPTARYAVSAPDGRSP